MKKIYIAPQTEAIELLGESAIMVGSGFTPIHGVGEGSGSGGMM
jgi:hypothetical protein